MNARHVHKGIAFATMIIAVAVVGCGGSLDAPSTPPPGNSGDGARIFATSCQGCHGSEAGGTRKGPPLVDRIYEPSHHGDAAFLLAIRNGSPEHHWSFGDMPPIPGLGDEDIANVTAYVRSLQRDAGIR